MGVTYPVLQGTPGAEWTGMTAVQGQAVIVIVSLCWIGLLLVHAFRCSERSDSLCKRRVAVEKGKEEIRKG